MRRKLSSVERMIDGNIVYFLRVEGSFTEERLRSSLLRVQRKHPALRMLIREEADGLYYEYDCAPSVPLRIAPRRNEEQYRAESEAELRTPFAYYQPQFRAVWLQDRGEQDLLLVTQHRICDGMSMLTLVREVLKSLYSEEELIPYAPITTKEIIGGFEPADLRRRKRRAFLMNTALQMLPSSRRAIRNSEHFLEWSLDRETSSVLRQRCKEAGVSIHAALVVAVDRALVSALGSKKMPAWIESPMDARRGRLTVLKSDTVFFGGGSLKFAAGADVDSEFWSQARVVHGRMQEMIEKELAEIPGRFHFYELLKPVPDAKVRSLVRLGNMMKMKGSWNRFSLSNLGKITVTDDDAPFHLKDLRLYVHSFNVPLLGLVSYMFRDEMRFYFVADEKCMSPGPARALQQSFLECLHCEIGMPGTCGLAMVGASEPQGIQV